MAFAPWQAEDQPFPNPIGLNGAQDVLQAASWVGLVVVFAAIVACIASLLVRYRHAGRVERQQLKWLLLAGAVVGVGIAVSIVIETTLGASASELSNAITSGAVATVPIAIGIAILRHRLFDIDVVINRTLVYAALTATLAATYLGSVLLLQLALAPLTESSGLAVAVSTLAAAAVFRPARVRIQGLVDRRFYRRRYDAARTLEAFGARLRDEVDLDTVAGDLRGVAREALQPAHVSVWLR